MRGNFFFLLATLVTGVIADAVATDNFRVNLVADVSLIDPDSQRR